jgi:hypothetical protein
MAKLSLWGISKNLKWGYQRDPSNLKSQSLRDVEDLRSMKEDLAFEQNSEQKHASQVSPLLLLNEFCIHQAKSFLKIQCLLEKLWLNSNTERRTASRPTPAEQKSAGNW